MNIFRKLITMVAGSSVLTMVRPETGLPPKIDRQKLIDEFKSWCYICGSRNGSAIASVPIKLYATRSTGEGRARRQAKSVDKATMRRLRSYHALQFNARLKAAEDVEEIYEHPVLDLLKNINPYENAFETFEKTSIFMDCTGDAYWQVVNGALGIPAEIYLLPSQWVVIVPDKDKYIKGYLYGDKKPPIPLLPEEVIHFRAPNPHNLFYGMGCIEGASSAVIRQGAYDRMELALADNSGIAPFLIRHDSNIQTKQMRDLEAMWNNYLKGYSRAGKIKIIGRDWDIKEVAMSPREMSFGEGRRWTRLEITDAFGVPVALLDTENVNLANAKTALYQYQKFTILPRLTRIDEKLNEALIPRYNEPRIFLAHDNPVPNDDEFDLRRTDIFLQRGVITPNEVRIAEGMDPVAWGDKPISAPTPVGPAPEEENDDEMEGGAGKSFFIGKAIGAGHVEPLTKRQASMTASLRAEFSKQEAYYLANLHLLVKRVEGYKIKVVEDLDSELADSVEEDVVAELVAGARNGWSKIPKSARPKVGIDEYISRPEYAAWARTHTIKFARKVNETTETKLRESLAESIDAGETVDSMKQRVRDIFTEARVNRAEMIARTESARAMSGGERDIYKSSGVVERMAWSAAGDACPFCNALDGKAVKIDGQFFGLNDTQTVEFEGKPISLTFDYEAIEGPPLHPSCRCSLVPVIQGVE